MIIMAKKNGSGHKKWVAGKDMPLFSGKSWKELEDIWPRQVRLESDAYKLMSVFAPAWRMTQAFMKANYGDYIRARDFAELCWFQRVEDAKENVALEAYPVLRGMNWGGKLFYLSNSRLTKTGCIENIPLAGARAYRITDKGKIIIKKFCESMDQVNRDLRMYIDMQPDFNAQKITDKLLSIAQKESPE